MTVEVPCFTTGGGTLAAPSSDLFSAEQEARTHLVEAHLRLVAFVARGYQGHGFPLSDLIQEGFFGLARAAQTFDPSQGAFSTYAVPWIRQAIRRAIQNTGRPIRLPSYGHEQLRALARAQDSLLTEQGHEPSIHELANALELPVHRVRLLLAHQHRMLSLDSPVSGHPDLLLADLIAEEPTPDVPFVEQEERRERGSRVQAALSCLTERERRVIALLFGLDGASGQHDCAQIGRMMGISRERVRQRKVRALSKLAGRADLAALLTATV